MWKNLALNEVKLTDTEFGVRRQLCKEYLRRFDTDRLMHTFRINAGLPSDAEPLGGWEAPMCGLRGHFVGHFLSACAKYAFADRDEELKQKTEQIVGIMQQCAQPNGYLSAFEESSLDILEAEENRGVWAPYYTLHKIMQGLIDCARLLDNSTAYELALNLAYYIRNRFQKLSYWKIDGILRCTKVNPTNEFGGIGDALYQLYELSRDLQIWELATLFDRDYFVGRLAAGQDILENLHANTHFPMIWAVMRRNRIQADSPYAEVPRRFYSFLKGRTFANGNSSSAAVAFIPGQVSERSEHWGAFGRMAQALTGGESESCCAHNTERIVQELFETTGDAVYLEHLECLKYNAVLNSASSRTGLSLYHQPMGTNVKKTFGDEYHTFWCCSGTGVEAMSEMQNNIWFADGDTVLINAYISSELHITEGGIRIRQESSFPDQPSTLVYIENAGDNGSCNLYLRTNSVESLSINDKEMEPDREQPLLRIDRLQTGDVLKIRIRADLHLEFLQGSETRAAVKYGSVLLAAVDAEPSLTGIRQEDLLARIRRTEERELRLELTDLAGKVTELIPLYRVEDQSYTVYLNLGNEKETAFQKAADGQGAYQ